MMKNTALLCTVAAILVGNAQGLLAQDDDAKKDQINDRVQAIFKRADSNGDGKISEDEAKQPFLKQLLSSSDKNKDGALSIEEFGAGIKARRASGGSRRDTDRPSDRPKTDRPRTDRPQSDRANAEVLRRYFKAMDKDGDGKVSKDDVPAERGRFKQAFGRMDKDKDGFVTFREFLAIQPGAARDTDRPKARDTDRPDRRANPASVLLQLFDRDQDHKISVEEARRFAQSIARMDKDGDGKASMAELTAAIKAMKDRRDGDGPKKVRRVRPRKTTDGDKKDSPVRKRTVRDSDNKKDKD